MTICSSGSRRTTPDDCPVKRGGGFAKIFRRCRSAGYVLSWTAVLPPLHGELRALDKTGAICGEEHDGFGNLVGGDIVLAVDVTGRVRTDSGPGLFTCVMAGLGIAIVSSAMAAAEVRARKLVPLLRGYRLEPIDVHPAFPAARAPIGQSSCGRRFSRCRAEEIG